mmetsp:Transcript_45118/g.97940  ORF Transcript_45118/g.97940 Transcript_45118/m.97940 type:complete len:291 (+) Transcript_45118:55-927(+)|eukprot:CAMPEP_0204273734 /NCGR_PEP_ID=MMETSP0468-20130131/24206_1 /ASSEMBLY_ACC=CAM_ASM_000383 /TAXON_ID=2969 /ORGANISM="Oxyrrhis marina" /LENGTH=290 /DNA_ID=CAMNT_0051249833 /DNA_START=55 /DNA_END=927 /DNA_ORIENTATION=+
MKPSNPFAPQRRRRLNLLAIGLNIMVPWASFTVVYLALSFSLHYAMPPLAWMVALTILAVAVVTFLRASAATQVPLVERGEPSWLYFGSILTLIAVLAGCALGDGNYSVYMEPYYNLKDLATYKDVNPGKRSGQGLMDAGKIYFSNNTKLDLSRAMAFKNQVMFCVAPIISADTPDSRVDFWAVGTDCCDGLKPQFRCGQYANPYARAGVRTLYNWERPYYRLAVQQAEAAYGLTALHPVFFTWVEDPLEGLNDYRDNGLKGFTLTSMVVYIVNMVVVVCTAAVYSKLGP